MRLALLSDVHGNPIALEAVLAEVAARGGADGYAAVVDAIGRSRFFPNPEWLAAKFAP